MYWHDGLEWLWMTISMGLWLGVLGVVVYVAVHLAQRDGARPTARRDRGSG